MTSQKTEKTQLSRQLKIALNLLKDHRLSYTAAIFLRFISNATYTLLVVLIGVLIDTLVRKPDTVATDTVRILMSFVAVTLIQNGSVAMSTTIVQRIAETIDRTLRVRLFDRSQRLPLGAHAKIDTGDLLQRATSDIDEGRRFYAEHILNLFRILFQTGTNLTALILINTKIALSSLILVPVIFVIAVMIMKRLGTAYEAFQMQEALISAAVQENLTGVRVVKAFARQDYEVSKFTDLLHNKLSPGYQLANLETAFWGITDIFCQIQTVASLIFSGYLAINGEITIGEFVAAQSYIAMIIWPVRGMGQVIVRSSRALVSLQRVQEILDKEEEPLDQGDLKPATTPPLGKIEFENVSFAYEPGTPTLRNVSFTVQPGQTVGILGFTGSGKSTILNLLLRFFDYDEGSIRLDGVELNRIPRAYLRHEIGAVEQEPFLFGRTIAENIALGVDREVTRDEIETAAKTASIHDAILEFEQGYDTKVGERGVTLSGGQKQRIAIARTILRDNRIILFDDATSAIDSDTERKIHEALNRATNKKTVFIVTHRIQSVFGADWIMVMKNGRIVQQGNHESLSAIPGLYRDMLNIQTKIESELEEEIAQ